MYKIFCDDVLICDSRIEDLAVINPIVTLELNTCNWLEFTFPPTHPYINEISHMTSEIRVEQDGEDIFYGFCSNESIDMLGNKHIECEGELSYLNDSILRPHRYQGYSVSSLLVAYLNEHNSQVEQRKQFMCGNVTVQDEYIYCFTNYNPTMQEVKEDLLDDLSGYIFVRHQGGAKYIDYYAEPLVDSSQIIELGKNLLDYDSNIDNTEIATRIIPLGQTLEGEESVQGLPDRLNITDVSAFHPTASDPFEHPSGSDYIENRTPVDQQGHTIVDQWGYITKVVTWDDVTLASSLVRKGKRWLQDNQFQNVVINVKAVDLNIVDKNIRPFKLFDRVRVKSAYHGMDKWFILSKIIMDLNNPENTVYTMGTNEKHSLTVKTNSIDTGLGRTVEKIDISEIQWLKEAQDHATALITGAEGGFVVLNVDNEGRPFELLVMDTDDKDTATHVWRWNKNGFGYSSTGYNGTYGTAITMDGQIVANYVKTGTLVAQNNLFELNMITGHVKMKDGEFTGSVTSSSINSGSITGADISGGNLTGAIISNGNKFYVSAEGGVTASAINITDGNIELARDSTVYPTKYIAILGRVEQSGVDAGVRLNAGGSIDVQQGTYHTYIMGYGSNLQGNVNIGGNLNVLGTVKQRVISTEHYGQVGLSAYETPKPTFADEGHGKLDENGVCYIYLNDVFLETIDTIHRYRVFLTKYGQGDIWVDEVQSTYIIIKGEPNLEFDWKVDCAQKGHNVSFLEPFKDNDDYDATDMSYESMADQYLHYYESEVLTNEGNY